jgi:hypothetical protein
VLQKFATKPTKITRKKQEKFLFRFDIKHKNVAPKPKAEPTKGGSHKLVYNRIESSERIGEKHKNFSSIRLLRLFLAFLALHCVEHCGVDRRDSSTCSGPGRSSVWRLIHQHIERRE